MRLTLLGMLSINSLSAFSGVNATVPLRGGDSGARLVQAAADQRATQPAPAEKRDLPNAVPNRILPRGSLLNLAV